MIDTTIVTSTILSLLSLVILYVAFGDIVDALRRR
jgi:hypothetical protein